MTEESLFAAALEKAGPAERLAFLVEACGGDAALLQRLQLLLAAHDKAHGILDGGAADPAGGAAFDPQATTAPAEPTLAIGAVVAGRYKVLESLGEGGMGTVFVAEQTQPVRRKVALKLIKAGMDSRRVLARFEAERQALALMDHPNIAKVLDGGLTESGRPYFVMEYIKGVLLTAYCDAARLTVRQRLELFIPVCQAVQHAHQKGIIHRDLKPSNILVALYDGKPVPKVIDFGLAKAIHQPLTESTLYTAHESVMGTPLYMSPEQAELNNLDIDTRTDIYALGVILYELLTGGTPLERGRFKKAVWEEILRIIREEEPPKPSTRLSGSSSLPALAAQRQLEPVKLARLLRGDLDWIVMKALDKDRNRRYETANGFALDVQRYLAEEPVLAGPPTASYRLRKFLRRNRRSVLATGVLLVALLGGIVGTTWGLVRAVAAETEAREAEQRERIERGRADASWKEAERKAVQERKARGEAVAALRDIASYVELRNLTTIRVTEDGMTVRGNDVQELMNNPLSTAERELLTKLLSYYVLSARELADAADEPLELASAYSNIGRIHKQFRDYPAAEAAFRAALAVCQRLHEGRAADSGITGQLVDAHSKLAETLMAAGRHSDAVSHWDQVLQLSPQAVAPRIRLSRALALARTERVAEALTEAGALLSELMPAELPHYNVACVYAQAAASGNADVDRFARRAVELLRLADEHGELLALRPTVAITYLKYDRDLDPLRGRDDFRRFAAIATIKIIDGFREPGSEQWVINVEPIASELLRSSADDAEPILRTCLAIREKKAPDDWSTFNTKSTLGGALLAQKKYADAEPLLLTGYEGMKQREAKIPPQGQTRLTEALERLVQLYDATGQKDKAEEWRKKLEEAKAPPKPAAKP